MFRNLKKVVVGSLLGLTILAGAGGSTARAETQDEFNRRLEESNKKEERERKEREQVRERERKCEEEKQKCQAEKRPCDASSTCR